MSVTDDGWMRLREIQHVLRYALPQLRFDTSQLSNTSNYRVDQFRGMLDAVRAIRETRMFQKETETILTTEVIVRHAESGFIVSVETVNRVNGALNTLRLRVGSLLETLDANLEPEVPET